MAKSESFDVTTSVDLQEVDNAVNQTAKEILQRYDFKNVKTEIAFDRGQGSITLMSEGEYQLDAIWTVLSQKVVKRGLPLPNFTRGDVEQVSGGNVRQEISMAQAIDAETARIIAKMIKERSPKKVQASIQGAAVRVSGPSRDDLQATIKMLKSEDFGVELKFGNYR